MVRVQIRPASDADASLWHLTREVAGILEPAVAPPVTSTGTLC